MTANLVTRDQTPDGHPDSPGDVPAGRSASLDRLDALIGHWEMEATFEAGYFGPHDFSLTYIKAGPAS